MQCRSGPEEGRQAGAQVVEAGAGRGIVGHAHAVVTHPQALARRTATGADLDTTTVHAGVDAVAHGVFHQRQQRHGREALCGQLGRYGDVPLQPVRHAHLHQLQVGTHQHQFIGQRGLAFVQARHGGAQVGDQALEHVGGAWRIAFHQRLHVGQGVEEEVRLDLRLQQRQACVHGLFFKAAALQLQLQRQRARTRLAFAQLRRERDQQPQHQRRAGRDDETGDAWFTAEEVRRAAAHGRQIDDERAQRRGQTDGDHGQQPARQLPRQPALGQALCAHESQQQPHRQEQHAPQQHREGRDKDRVEHHRRGDGKADGHAQAACVERGPDAAGDAALSAGNLE